MNRQKNVLRITRRDAIKLGFYGAAGMALPDVFCLAGEPASKVMPAKARAVIQIWMWGGPSHLDTFDPKPEAGYDYCGPFNKPIETNVKGIRVCEMLPLLAKQADKYSIIRSMTHGINAHETASYRVQTGHEPGRLVYPSVGAVVSLFRGYDHGYKGIVPPYIVLTQPQGRFSEAGFLGQKYKPFATGGDPAKTPFAVEGIIAKGISDQRQQQRRMLLHSLDSLGAAMPKHPQFQQLDKCEEKAYEMMFGEARKLFDLSEEKDELREKYGKNTFGQACLTARRLVEHGVPYVTINYKGWDTHKQHFEAMRRMLPQMDAGFATLLQDLADRSLLDSTIIWWGGEFGRGPKIDWNPPWNGGRSHYGKCFSVVLAGGGFKGGQVIGTSNKTGTEPAGRPVQPQELIASLYERMGIDPEGSLPNSSGLDVKVMPGAGRLKEIMPG